MNFVVAALILARFHEISSLAACSESCGDTLTDADFNQSSGSPNYEAESDIFWLFQSLLSPFQPDGSLAPSLTRIAAAPNWLVPDGRILCFASIWSHGFPKMKLRVYQFDRFGRLRFPFTPSHRLLQWNLPQLSSHLQLLGLSTEVVVSQWFMTMFAYAVMTAHSL